VKLAHRLLLQSLAIIAVMVVSVVVIVDNEIHSLAAGQQGSVATGPADDANARARREIIAAGFASFALAAVLAALFSRGVSKPIADLTDVARSLGAGDLRRRPALVAPGEVGDLADAIHRLAEQLEARLSALGAEQSVLSALVETLNEGVLAISPSREVVRISETGRRLLLVNRPVPFGIDFLPRDATLRNAILLALSGTETEPEEIVIGATTLSLTARPLVNGGAVVALFDLTPIRKLEAVRRDFVANVSHELRTPLTIIGGFAETLQDPDVPPARRVEFAKTIFSNAHRMQRIVDELLDLSRIETGHWKPKPELIRITDLATELFGRVAPTASTKGVSLETEIESGGEAICADRTALEQILLNLVENSLRHTGEGGRITIRTEREEGGVSLTVTDTGSGIPPEHLPRIFERFYRADSGRSREAGGTGLGLAIVRHLVEAHGGTVKAESVQGVGTTIRIFFSDGPVPAQS
jgi:two-component system, OmpR family, phosphate regulon sensor histidine kinase PhoR